MIAKEWVPPWTRGDFDQHQFLVAGSITSLRTQLSTARGKRFSVDGARAVRPMAIEDKLGEIRGLVGGEPLEPQATRQCSCWVTTWDVSALTGRTSEARHGSRAQTEDSSPTSCIPEPGLRSGIPAVSQIRHIERRNRVKGRERRGSTQNGL